MGSLRSSSSPGPLSRAEPGPGLAPVAAALQEDSIDVSDLCNHPASAPAHKQGFGGGVCVGRACGFLHSLIQPSALVFSHRTGTVETFGGSSALNETAAMGTAACHGLVLSPRPAAGITAVLRKASIGAPGEECSESLKTAPIPEWFGWEESQR